MSDYLFRGELAELDPDVAELIRHETARQQRYLILIPSESTVPHAVREALASSFHNLYAEGYPLDETRRMTQAEILDYGARLPEYRRLADKRYYKGTEYADIVEALARRRVAELFATAKYPADKLFVNVQPLSGAPANNAIFSGLLAIGDTIMGLDLLQGGHLTHGSPVNRSGKQYKAAAYSVDPATEKLDYDQIRAKALETHPKIIIAGFTSYPYAPDWAAFRSIADEVGAYLMADVSHVAGMIAAGAYPSPIGIADIVSFTTHKTMGGPRGAVIVTHRSDVANKVDRAVFPGEQGGPHVNQMAALAVALRLARTDQFRELQHQTVRNAAAMVEALTRRGMRIAYGGTDTHMLLLDCKTVVGADGTPLSGDIAARILDLAGIVANRNTIPGDPSALRASGVRIGLPWVTQRGFKEAESIRLADLIADLLTAAVPFSYMGRKRAEPRAKVPFEVLMRVKSQVRDLAASVGIDTAVEADDYPHFFYFDPDTPSGWGTLRIRDIGHVSPAHFLNTALTSDVLALAEGQQQPTRILNERGEVVARGVVQRDGDVYLLHVEDHLRAAQWLRALSDGFTLIDNADPHGKTPGPVDVQVVGPVDPASLTANWQDDAAAIAHKAYFIGARAHTFGDPLPAFAWTEPTDGPVKHTPIHGLHLELKGKMAAFAGYDMPLWYSSVGEEHAAVRKGVGVFDVTHMGAFDVTGPDAAAFLDVVTTNDVHGLAVGDSHYTYLFDDQGVPLDDLMIYRLGAEEFLVVVNASNNDKNWAWLNAVLEGRVRIDADQPDRRVAFGDRVRLRDLRAESTGKDQRVDIALQGPGAKALLQTLLSDADKARIGALPWAGVSRATLHGSHEYDAIISRTGYTGERIAYEIFVHPAHASELFRDLINAGATPCGLAARDSLRTEAGLPLYGHELGGEHALNPADAGFGSYVKLWKPFFVGKAAFIAREARRDSEVVRFRMEQKGVRPPHPGDPVLDRKGRVIGMVTSCSLDSEGYQLGQAYIKDDYTTEFTPIAVFCGAARAKTADPAHLTTGDKYTLPEPAVVLSRFPKRG